MLTEVVGWASAIVLLLTMMRQVYTQWKTRSTAGVSRYLFLGQVAASLGFTVYSGLVGNQVFMATNLLMLCNALLGQWIYIHNRRRSAAAAPRPAAGTSSEAAAQVSERG